VIWTIAREARKISISAICAFLDRAPNVGLGSETGTMSDHDYSIALPLLPGFSGAAFFVSNGCLLRPRPPPRARNR
jgi:hypothetical protein